MTSILLVSTFLFAMVATITAFAKCKPTDAYELYEFRRDLVAGMHVTINDGSKYLYNRVVERTTSTHVIVSNNGNRAIYPKGQVYPVDYFNQEEA